MEMCLSTVRCRSVALRITEMVGIFHKRKVSHKRKSRLFRLPIKTCLFFAKKLFFHSFLKVVPLRTSPNNKIESGMAYNTTTALDKLTCTDYVDCGNCQNTFGRISWSKNSFEYLDVKLKVFKIDENKEFDWHKTRQWERQTLISLYD